jgi:hypothetical protein
MDAKNYIKALNLFVLNDDYRPSLRSYSVEKEFTYATDAHTAIRIPTKVLGKWYSPIGGFPDVEKCFPPTTRNIKLDKQFLLDALSIKVESKVMSYILIDKFTLSISFLERLIKVSKLLKSDIYMLNNPEDEKPAKFQIGEATIVVMPIHEPDEINLIAELNLKP